MKRFAFLLAFLPAAALAQPAPMMQQQPPEVEALQQSLLEATSAKLNYQARSIALQRQVDDLTKQLAEARKAPESPKPEAHKP